MTLTASQMASMKWKNMTPEEKAEHLKKMRSGFRKHWKGKTTEEKSEIMKKVRAGSGKKRTGKKLDKK